MIPLVTTTVTLKSRDAAAETWDPDADYATIATGVSAHIGGPTGNHLRTVMGNSQLVDKILDCDLLDSPVTDLPNGLCIDEVTGQTYGIEWAADNTDALGLGHIRAGLTYREGAAANE